MMTYSNTLINANNHMMFSNNNNNNNNTNNNNNNMMSSAYRPGRWSRLYHYTW
jgi:hypothetical protein